MIKKAGLFDNIIDMLEDRGCEIDEIELEGFLEDISDDEYFDLKKAIAKGDEETVMEFIGDLPLKPKTSNRKKRKGFMQKKAITPVKPTKKVDKGKYTAPDGSFKEMSCPKGHEGKTSKFCGCLRYQMARGLPLENAEALCGYIKKKKEGDKLYDNFEKVKKTAQYELGDGFELYFYDLKRPIQNELLAFFGMNDPSEGNFEDIPVVVVPQMEREEEPMEEEFASVEPRRRGKPLTDKERLKRHKKLYPEEDIEDEEDLPERGRGLKRGERYHPPTTEELKVDPSETVDVFLSERTPEKGSDVSDEWEKWCDEKKISDEAEEGGMSVLRGRGFKVSKVEKVTTSGKSAHQRFMEKKAGMFYVEKGDEVELSKDWESKEWIDEVGWLESSVVELDAGLKGEVVYTSLEGEFQVDWENGIRTIEIADVETEDAIKKIGTVKKAWTIEKKKISEGEHKKRLDKIRAYEKDIARELNQDEAEKMYSKLGREGIETL